MTPRTLTAVLSGILALAGTLQAQTPEPIPVAIKIACIGNSITEGVGTTSSGTKAYPVRLAAKMGPAYTVLNAGVSATTLLKRGDTPYWTRGKFAQVFAQKPDIITIKLGTNDTKPQNWQYNSEFQANLNTMIDTLQAMSSHPEIWLCTPAPIFNNTFSIRDSIATKYIIPIIKIVAAARGLNVIDINTALRPYPALFPDGVHPNDAGADSIAAIIHRTIVAKKFRIACIGNSITEYAYGGAATGAVAKDAHPIRLAMMLGRNYYVQNFGVSGLHMQKYQGYTAPTPAYWEWSYWGAQGKLPGVFAMKPHLVTIKLGTNDARNSDWNSVRYRADYQAMVDTLRLKISPAPEIRPVLPLPVLQVNGQWPFDGINGNTIRDSVIPIIQQVAALKGLTVIDPHTPFLAWPELTPDGGHPSAAGQDSLAHLLYRALALPAVGVRQAGRTRNAEARLGSLLYAGMHPVAWNGRGVLDLPLGTRLFTLDGKPVSMRVIRGGILAPGIYLLKNPGMASKRH